VSKPPCLTPDSHSPEPLRGWLVRAGQPTLTGNNQLDADGQCLVAASGGSVRDHGLLSGLPPGGVQHRTDYPAVSTAAAQIAVESFSHLLVGRGWVVPQEPAVTGVFTADTGTSQDDRA
jgi:hypothetical protein